MSTSGLVSLYPFMHLSASYLFGSFGAALRTLPRTVGGGRAPLRCLRVDILGHVDVVVQQHLLLHPCGRATGGSGGGGGLSLTRLRELLQAPPAAAPAVSLQASARLGAAATAVGGQEG